MFVEVQSSWFQVISFHHTFVEALLFNLTFFCFLFFLFSFFSSYILLWNSSIGASFFYVSASCSFYLSWIRSILLSLCNISSWNLLLILLSSSKRSSNVLRRVSSSFILFSWSNSWHSFLAIYNIWNSVLVFFIVTSESTLFHTSIWNFNSFAFLQ